MRHKNVVSYVDSGSVSLFTRQITEALGNVLAVAIHDTDAQIVWSDDGADDARNWAVKPFLRERSPGVGYCERLSNRNFAYVFYLRRDGSGEDIGTLSVQIDGANATNIEAAHREIRAILECIERQIAINAELSAVRRVTADERKGLDLLVRLDELAGSLAPPEIVHSVLGLCARHFGADVAVVLMPKIGIQEVYPAALSNDKIASKSLMTTLGSLLSAATTHRKVSLTESNLRKRLVPGLQNDRPRVLSSPIVNAKDEVIGIFALLKSGDFPREQVRLSRAICAKINALTRASDQFAENHYSRHGFLHHVSAVLQRSRFQSHAVLLVDIDQLHVVNDSFGHMAGDEVIRMVSRIVDDTAGADDAITHLGGGTYAVFLRNSGEADACTKADTVLECVAREVIEYDGKSIQISASIGIALIPEVVADAAAALNTAEVAAKSAKSRGGNRLVVFKDVDASLVQRRSDLDGVNSIQSALIHDRFVLYAQPIRSLRDSEGAYHYEVLIRMLDDNDQVLPPVKFLSAAERYQMMAAIDRWVIRNTLDQLSAADNLLEVSLASFNVNLSAQSIADDEFLGFVETQITQSGVSPDSLCFEITETSAVRNLESAQRCIKRLRKLGCRLALDDFGTGYCSFAYLKDLPVQYVKIDGVFVRDILENPLSEAIVASLTKIAKVMRAATVAEHVENDLVLQRLRQYDVDFGQGFGIGKPVPLADVLDELGPPVEVLDIENRRQHR